MFMKKIGSKYFTFSSVAGVRQFLVSHSYVKDIYDQPQQQKVIYRQQHEDLLQKLQAQGNQIIGGSLFPMEGAYYIFNSKDDSAAKEFVQNDPYITNKLVSQFEIEELNQFTNFKYDRLSQLLGFK